MKAFLDILEESICVVDYSGNILYLNKAAWQYLGYDAVYGEIAVLDARWYRDVDQEMLQVRHQNERIHEAAFIWEAGTWEGQAVQIGRLRWSGYVEGYERVRLLEGFVDTCKANIIIKDHNGKFVFVNQTFANAVGTPRDEILGKCDRDFWHDEIASRFKKSDDYILDTHEHCMIEDTFEEEGKKKYYETNKFYIKACEGKVGIVTRDITFYRILLDQLTRHESAVVDIEQNDKLEAVQNDYKGQIEVFLDELRTYFGTEYIDVWQYDEEKECLEICASVESPRALCNGQTTYPITKEEVAHCMQCEFGNIHRAKVDEVGDHIKQVCNAGHLHEFIDYPIIYQGKFLGTLSIIYDTSEERFMVKNYFMNHICQQLASVLKDKNMLDRLAEELKHRLKVEEELRAILSLSTDLIITVDKAGNHKSSNSGCSQVLGWSHEAFLKMSWKDLIHPDDYERTRETYRYWQEGIVQRQECINRYLCADGTYTWLRWDGYYKKDDNNYLTVARDINKEMMLKTKEDLEKRVTHVEEVRTEFFANLSHEFKTPLTITLAAVQMLEAIVKECCAEHLGVLKYVRSIKQNSYRLLRMVNNLIDVTRIDADYYIMKVKNHNIDRKSVV